MSQTQAAMSVQLSGVGHRPSLFIKDTRVLERKLLCTSQMEGPSFTGLGESMVVVR